MEWNGMGEGNNMLDASVNKKGDCLLAALCLVSFCASMDDGLYIRWPRAVLYHMHAQVLLALAGQLDRAFIDRKKKGRHQHSSCLH